MFNFLKRDKTLPTKPEVPVSEKPSFFKRLTQGLRQTRHQLSEGLATLIYGKKQIDATLMEDLETCLLSADIGVAATEAIMADLTQRVARGALSDPKILLTTLQELLLELLENCDQPFLPNVIAKPEVILLVGINGAGKTTTIGKLSYYLQNQEKKVLLAAGDTFRAAAVEQLQIWGERNQTPVIAQHTGSDSASVIFDAYTAAKARGYDLLLADTAGRLHTQQHLMDELKKVKRVVNKMDATAPHHIWLILDASIGQNALRQAAVFHEAIGLTGICVTKLDGTAKGGILFAIAKQFMLPIYFIGIGENIDDLRPFVAKTFVEALFNEGGNYDSC